MTESRTKPTTDKTPGILAHPDTRCAKIPGVLSAGGFVRPGVLSAGGFVRVCQNTGGFVLQGIRPGTRAALSCVSGIHFSTHWLVYYGSDKYMYAKLVIIRICRNSVFNFFNILLFLNECYIAEILYADTCRIYTPYQKHDFEISLR